MPASGKAAGGIIVLTGQQGWEAVNGPRGLDGTDPFTVPRRSQPSPSFLEVEPPYDALMIPPASLLVLDLKRLRFRDVEEQLARELHSARELARLVKMELNDREMNPTRLSRGYPMAELRTMLQNAEIANSLALRRFTDFVARRICPGNSAAAV